MMKDTQIYGLSLSIIFILTGFCLLISSLGDRVDKLEDTIAGWQPVIEHHNAVQENLFNTTTEGK
jgi:hypothetical protein